MGAIGQCTRSVLRRSSATCGAAEAGPLLGEAREERVDRVRRAVRARSQLLRAARQPLGAGGQAGNAGPASGELGAGGAESRADRGELPGQFGLRDRHARGSRDAPHRGDAGQSRDRRSRLFDDGQPSGTRHVVAIRDHEVVGTDLTLREVLVGSGRRATSAPIAAQRVSDRIGRALPRNSGGATRLPRTDSSAGVNVSPTRSVTNTATAMAGPLVWNNARLVSTIAALPMMTVNPLATTTGPMRRTDVTTASRAPSPARIASWNLLIRKMV